MKVMSSLQDLANKLENYQKSHAKLMQVFGKKLGDTQQKLSQQENSIQEYLELVSKEVFTIEN